MYESIARLYADGYFTIANLQLFLEVHYITQEQYDGLVADKEVRE